MTRQANWWPTHRPDILEAWGGYGWRNYNARFRQQRAAGIPLEWTQVEPSIMVTSVLRSPGAPGSHIVPDPPCPHCGESNHKGSECALVALNQKSPLSTQRTQRPHPYTPTLSNELCRKFNRRACHFPRCQYSHACSKCGAREHPAISCTKPATPTGTDPAH